jgi:hypothetical protein
MIFLWVAVAIILLSCRFHRVGLSMLCPIAAPFFLWNWWKKKRDGVPTDSFSSLDI